VLKKDETHRAASGDETLMLELKGGRVEALAVLFDRYQRLVFTVAKRILRDSAEAEDLTQDVFIEIYRKANLYDPGKGSFKTWVLQYAYHRSFNRRKYLALRHSHRASPEIPQNQRAPEGAGSYDQLIRHRVCVETLKRGMAALTDKERVVIEWVSFEGLTLREASTRMRVSYVNVRNHYYRGLRKLRRIAVERSGTHHRQCKTGTAANSSI
jgi:RNA polymerase sigma-70 factor (ECF subfamily)